MVDHVPGTGDDVEDALLDGCPELLGPTLDDAAGECFDKTAKLLGLPQPGGPALEALARTAKNPGRIDMPRPLIGRPGNNLSFSGLKTAMRERIAAKTK